jgi:hypothetical protein
MTQEEKGRLLGPRWITYKGVQLLYVDYTSCTSDQEMLATMEEEARMLKAYSGRPLALDNLTGTTISSAFMSRAKELGKEVAREHGGRRGQKTALLGITGFKQALLQTFIFLTGYKSIRSFSSEAEALDWLVEAK